MRVIGLAVFLAVSLTLAPLAAEGQPQSGKIARVGLLWFGPSPSTEQIGTGAFAAAMRERSWVEGQNLMILRRYHESIDQLRAFAAELELLQVDAIVVGSADMAAIARREAKNTPIVIHSGGLDFVRTGLVASLARPGGNITGTQNLQSDTFGKRLQILKEVVPNLSRVAWLGEDVTGGGGMPRSELATPSRPLTWRVRSASSFISLARLAPRIFRACFATWLRRMPVG